MIRQEEYKFKGYCKDIHYWVYGGIIHITSKLDSEGNEYEIDDYYIITEEGVQFKVDKRSICRYLDVKDDLNTTLYTKDLFTFNNYKHTYTILYNENKLKYELFRYKNKRLIKCHKRLNISKLKDVIVFSNIYSTEVI